MTEEHDSKQPNWSLEEVDATIRTYLRMLQQEVEHVHYVKSHANSQLIPLLNNRSKAAVEKKHQNISAILTELNLPYIDGYKPLRNVQNMLREKVIETLDRHLELHDSLKKVAINEVQPPISQNILNSMVPAPEFEARKEYGKVRDSGMTATGRFIDYVELEARNSSLGLAGEEFVIRFEIERLSRAGQERLASKIEHVSKTKGDGYGFDILSFDTDGRERLIEVKTTKFGIHMPFYLSMNELSVSRAEREKYQLFRVFNFRDSPKMFRLEGAIDANVNLEPTQYLGRVR
jgi:hypothetical protein